MGLFDTKFTNNLEYLLLVALIRPQAFVVIKAPGKPDSYQVTSPEATGRSPHSNPPSPGGPPR
jgi:hypothetical protein